MKYDEMCKKSAGKISETFDIDVDTFKDMSGGDKAMFMLGMGILTELKELNETLNDIKIEGRK